MFKSRICLLFTLGVLLVAAVASAGSHKVRVNDPALAKSLIARGGRLVADYGSFQLIEGSPAMFGGIKTAHMQNADDSDLILLNAQRLDTRLPEVRALHKAAGNFTGKQLHLVQFVGPVKPEWHDALEKSGVRIVSYIPKDSYLVYGDATALARMQSWATVSDYVQWDGQYLNDYKIHPKARNRDAKGNPRKIGTDVFEIQMVADDAANPATLQLIDKMKLTPVQKSFNILDYRNVIVELPAAQLAQIASRPDVISIQPYFEPKKMDERQDQIIAGNLSGNSPSGPGYLAWLASKGFTQAQFTNSGFAVDVSDSGIDNGTTLPGHFGLYQFGDPSQPSRVVYNRLEGTPNSGSTLEGCDGHGNLNTHIIGGYNDLADGFPHTDSAGFHYGLGVCPFVKVGSSVIFDPDTFTRPNYANLQSQAYHDGARISANSWGASTAGAYDAQAQAYDALVRDAQPSGSTYAASSNQQMVIVFAAGNDGPGTMTVGSPGTAKNVITVGAAENVRSLSVANGGYDSGGDSGCQSDADSDADSANDIASFSSEGPCSDGRMKPDIVAPGTHITGGVAQSSTNVLGNGSAISCFDATGVCALPGGGSPGSAENFFPLGQQFYTVSSGTSHSTPATAGACALLRQYFINDGLTPPSPAMTKAYLMNSARYMNGVGANDTLWSVSQGMGELNLGVAFDGVPRILRDQASVDKFTATGQTRTFSGTITDPTKPFRVTLAWTDAPGNTSGNAFNNNLDLTVTVGGQTYLGNVFSGANSVPGGTADSKDNVESVFLPAGTSGSFVITVTAANINSDGVPNEAPSLDQDFALVAYNAVQTSVPIIAINSYTLVAEDCSPTNGTIDPGEMVTVNFTLGNVGTLNTTNLVATLMETNGVMSPSGPQVYGALMAGGATVSRSFSFVANGSCGSSISPTFQLQDGTNNLGIVAANIQLGQMSSILTQNFDTVTAPVLPALWSTSAQDAQSPWVTSTDAFDTTPNAAFSSDPANPGINELDSPTVLIPANGAQLSFRHIYNLEASSVGYDGGVLEIAIGGGAFTDILSAGGSFVSGGYTKTISSSYGSPLAGRQAWSGASSSFTTTLVNLPPSANGQSVQFRWRCGTDSGNIPGSWTGWYVDSISVLALTCCTNNPSISDLGVNETVSDSVVSLGSNVTYTITVTNIGPDTASNVVVTDTLPAGLTFVSATASQGTYTNINGLVSFQLGTMTSGAQATLTLVATATGSGSLTSMVVVSSSALDPISANNSIATTAISPPIIQSIMVSNNIALIKWTAISGQTYQVWWNPDLSNTNWKNLLPDVMAFSSNVSATDSVGSTTQKFYRVGVTP